MFVPGRSVQFLAILGTTLGLLYGDLDAQAAATRERNWSGHASRVPDLPMLFTIAAAEREGASFPRDSSRIDTLRAQLIARAEGGSPERKCHSVQDVLPQEDPTVPAVSRWGMRAGDFVAGGTIHNQFAWRPGKIWWAPIHDPSPRGDALLIRGARLGSDPSSGDTIRFVITGYGFPPDRNSSGAFFPSGFGLPRVGRWLFVAIAGFDWGCLIMNIVERK
jgi:hypothetical protein